MEVAVAAEILVTIGRGIGVRVEVTSGGATVKVGVLKIIAGVALNKASTVCAAEVLAISSALFEGRLHALKNKVKIISR